MSGRKRVYYIESHSAWMSPTGKAESAALILYSRDDGPPLHHIFCDRMQRLHTLQATKTIVIDLLEGATVEITFEEENEFVRWVKHIGLLLSIPYYPIPQEPTDGVLLDDLWMDVDPKFYHPQGVMAWGMYALQEGIGSRAGLKDAPCVAVVTDTDRLLVFPWKVTCAVIDWDRTHLRRSGSVGNLVFLEAGRRCMFGAGLLWMHNRSTINPSLREGMHTFLFKGSKAFESACDEGVTHRTSPPDGATDESDVFNDPPKSPESDGTFELLFPPGAVGKDSGIGKSSEKHGGIPLPLPPLSGRKHSSLTSGYGSGNLVGEDISPNSQASHLPFSQAISPKLGCPSSVYPIGVAYGGVFEELTLPQPQEPGQCHKLADDSDYVKMHRAGLRPQDDTNDYVSMSPGRSPLQQNVNARHQPTWSMLDSPQYPQHQEQLLGKMKGLSMCDKPRQGSNTTVQPNGVSDYDNVRLRPPSYQKRNSYENAPLTP